VTWRGVTAAVLGIFFTAALWWTHFDVIAPAARIAQHAAQGRSRVVMARDVYAYCQLVMIGGIMLFALGAEEMVRQIADGSINLAEPTHGPGVPLLFGGVICYLCGGMLFQLRALGTLSWTRVGTVLVLAVAIPLATHLPALAALSLLTAICIGLVATEVAVMADARRALLKAVFEEKTTYEKHEADWRARWHEGAPDEKPR
ncbi:low temperature requirement protein A, partial [Micromonospora palomenae]|uniref:low temperature requirement protein A n=1 Tax=Micromonospora palomenae TaxID=1461247 RepID=UPI003F8CA2E5